MANPEHLALARNGSKSINAFASQTPRVALDLTGADLTGMDLRDCDLQEGNLAGVNLMGADLRNARLGGANLEGAILRDADARGTGLHRANLQGADFRGIKMDPIGTGHQLMCMSPKTFANARWDRERLEEIMNALNLNRDWQIRYEILPRG